MLVVRSASLTLWPINCVHSEDAGVESGKWL